MATPSPATGPPLTVMLADDHRIVREGIKRILQGAGDILVIGEADNGHDALRLARETHPRVAVLDLSLPGLAGMDLIRRIRTECPDVALLVLTMHAEEQYAMRAFRAGAHGYLTKDSASDELVTAVRRLAGGGGYVSPGMAERLAFELNGLRGAPPHSLLSNREFEVMRHLVAGQRLTEIADAMHLSIKTVSTHKSRLLDKLGLGNTAALVKYALRHQLFDDLDGGG